MSSFTKILLLASVILLTSCQSDPCATKEGFLESFDTFMTDFDAARENLSDNKRDEMVVQFKGIVNDCYKKHKGDMTLEEKQDFWKNGLKFYITKFTSDTKINVSETLEDPFDQYVKDEVIALVKESGLGFLSTLQEAVEVELPKLMEIFASEIDKISQDLMKLFQ